MYVCDIHAVIDNTLRRFEYCEGPWHEPMLEDVALLQGLERVALESVPFDLGLVTRALNERSTLS
jgi:hypothetical protein